MNVDDAADLLERQITKIEPAIEKFYKQLKLTKIQLLLKIGIIKFLIWK